MEFRPYKRLRKSHVARKSGSGSASPSPSLLDLPDDMIFEIIKRVGRDCYRSFVNAKVACKTFKRISEEPKVIQEIAVNQIPLFHEERDEKFQEVIDACLDGGFFFQILIFFSYWINNIR